MFLKFKAMDLWTMIEINLKVFSIRLLGRSTEGTIVDLRSRFISSVVYFMGGRGVYKMVLIPSNPY